MHKKKKQSPKVSKQAQKRVRETAEQRANIDPNRSASPDNTTVEGRSASGSVLPPSKKQKVEVSTSSISEEEVKRYLLRRPIASKDLVRKFTNKKTDMDRNKIVEVLHQIIEKMKNVNKQTVKGKLYLSLPASTDETV